MILSAGVLKCSCMTLKLEVLYIESLSIDVVTDLVQDDLQKMRRQNGRSGPIFEESGRRNLLAEVVGARARGSILKGKKKI